MHRKQLILASSLLVTLLLIVPALPVLQSLIMHQHFHGRWLDEPAPDFRLTTNNGHTRGLSDFEGQYLFVYFGYLHCDGFCQNQWITLFHTMQQLAHEPVKTILITIDPERDSAQAAQQLAADLGTNFVSVRGDYLNEVQSLARAYHQAFERSGWSKSQDYQVNHVGDILLIAPDRRIKLVYSSDKWQYDQLVEDYQLLKQLQEKTNGTSKND